MAIITIWSVYVQQLAWTCHEFGWSGIEQRAICDGFSCAQQENPEENSAKACWLQLISGISLYIFGCQKRTLQSSRNMIENICLKRSHQETISKNTSDMFFWRPRFPYLTWEAHVSPTNDAIDHSSFGFVTMVVKFTLIKGSLGI